MHPKTSGFGLDAAERTASRILEQSPAEETEVSVDRVEDRFVRFAESGPTQTADRSRVELAVRVRLKPEGGGSGLCEARAIVGSFEWEDAEAVLAKAVDLARASAPKVGLVPLGGPCEVAPTSCERSTRDHGFDAKARWVGAALARAKQHALAPAGLAQTSSIERALWNSNGRAVRGAFSRAAFALTLSHAEGSGFAEHIAASADAIEVEPVVERALQKSLESRAPRDIPPGEYTVVLEPAAVSPLLLFMTYQGFGAQAVEEKASFLCGRIGQRVLSESLTISDDAYHPLYPGFTFDGEGSPRQRVVLVDAGRLGGPVTCRKYAHKLGVENTGHALAQPNSEGPRPLNLAVTPGEKSLEELIAGVDRGLLITQLHYTNVIEPRELSLTGMTRNGTFWIEGGRVRHPVRNLRFTQSLVQALGRVRGIGRDLAVVGASFEGEMIAPSMCIDAFRFTSTADF